MLAKIIIKALVSLQEYTIKKIERKFEKAALRLLRIITGENGRRPFKLDVTELQDFEPFAFLFKHMDVTLLGKNGIWDDGLLKFIEYNGRNISLTYSECISKVQHIHCPISEDSWSLYVIIELLESIAYHIQTGEIAILTVDNINYMARVKISS